jgi:hypothetical protein
MLGVVLCNAMALPAILRYAKERFPGIKVHLEPISNIRCRFRKKSAPQIMESSTTKSPSAFQSTMPRMSVDGDRASVLTEPLPVYQPNYNLERGLNGDFDSHDDESWTEEKILPWSPLDGDLEKQEETCDPR